MGEFCVHKSLGNSKPQLIRQIKALAVFIPAWLLVAYYSFQWRNFQQDDALIYLRYIRNFRHGLGLVYNPGEKFNGLTSPLFTYLSLVGSIFVHNLQMLTIGLCAIFLAGTAYFAAKLISKTKLGQGFTAAAVVTFGPFYLNYGMETSLFLFLIVLSLCLYKRDSGFFAVALALLIATRTEGIFLALAILTHLLISRRSLPKLRFIFTAAVVVATPFLFNYFYYGDFIASTGAAKIGQGKSGYWGQWTFFEPATLDRMFFSGREYLAVAGATLAAYGIYKTFNQNYTKAALIFLGLLGAFYGGLNIPSYQWYYAPFFLFALVYSCYGIEIIFQKLWNTSTSNDARFVAGALVCAVLFSTFQFAAPVGGTPHEAYTKIGVWLKKNTTRNATVGLAEIGTVGWHSNRFIIDILGLTNKYNADFLANKDVFSWLTKYQPDYILRHEPYWAMEASVNAMETNGFYEVDPAFKVDGFVLTKKSSKHSDAEIATFAATLKPK